MKNKEAVQVRFHVGVNISQQVFTSIDAARDGATLEILPIGVHIKLRGEECIVPYANIHQVKLKP